MIDQGLLTAASIYVGVLIGVGALLLLALAAWGVRAKTASRHEPLTARAQRHSGAPKPRTPHPVH
ncbi:hypothetical protein [Cryptosporangium sp. NPDC051539]|uniref:hypothetical protein n=1 Tax=Cryptosporangium sp. NPDC051539 TaxID=3363962 RepID=UPI0037ACFCAD